MAMRTKGGWLGAILLGNMLGCSSTEESAIVEARQDLSTDATSEQAQSEGRSVGRKLMIIGNQTDAIVGSVTEDAIFVDRLIADVGGTRHLNVLIVPGASEIPSWLYGYLGEVLRTRGVPKKNLELAHIANVDDEATPDVDESTWSNGAYLPAEVEKVSRANVVWYAGGDQSRLVSLLLDQAGNDSPFQAAVRSKLAGNNLIVAGYSAGAAIMSDPMIGGGTSWGALTLAPDPDPACNTVAICVTRGLGYIPAEYSVLTDQHFMERGRFARTIRALSITDRKTAWGVDAYTAFYVDLNRGVGEVIGVPGKGSVAILGREGAAENHEQAGQPFLGDGYRVSVLAVGDTYTLPDAANPHGVPSRPEGSDYYEPFSQYYSDLPIFTDAFGKDVLYYNVVPYFADGTPLASGPRVDAIALLPNESGSAAGFRLRFTAGQDSEVAWNDDAGYSMFNARLQISTVSAQITGVGP